MMAVSAMIPRGDWAETEVVSPSMVREAWAEHIPSWEAAVGMETKWTPALTEASLATSIDLPPPTPMRKPASISAASFSALSTSSSFENFVIMRPVSKPRSSIR